MVMALPIITIFLIFICGCVVQNSNAKFGIRGGFTIDDGRYTLQWEVHYGWITLRATARGTGFVGFGISPTGTFDNADLFLAGLHDNGTVYAQDSHGAGMKDAMQNYILLYVEGGPMYTTIHFRRALMTGDDKEDIAIMNDDQKIIWAIGPAMDKLEVENGGENSGSVTVNLLNPPMFHMFKKTGMMAGGSGGGGDGAAAAPASDAETTEE